MALPDSTSKKTSASWEIEDAGKRPSQRLANVARRYAIHNDIVEEHLARPSIRAPVARVETVYPKR
jgi:hypothetical protein